ncbi:MAG: YicC family protein [Planctomycetia bacterium]|nr:YicC family protein [Planctomycetia bacterium]
MLLSMTGYGEAHTEREGLRVGVELRTVNNRYFKLTLRSSEGYSSLEAEIESVLRGLIKRGTIQVTLDVYRDPRPEDFQLNLAALEIYRTQLEELCRRWGVPGGISPDKLVLLPGVVRDAEGPGRDVTADWPVVKETLEAAVRHLEKMRQDEGAAMAVALRQYARQIAAQLVEIRKRAPFVLESYRARLEERLKRSMGEMHAAVETADLARELTLFSDRSDISEEVVRLSSHVDQLLALVDSPETSGRKLEFLTQEMFREANTIGSKANDVEISRRIIEVKTDIERVREMIQNIE